MTLIYTNILKHLRTTQHSTTVLAHEETIPKIQEQISNQPKFVGFGSELDVDCLMLTKRRNLLPYMEMHRARLLEAQLKCYAWFELNNESKQLELFCHEITTLLKKVSQNILFYLAHNRQEKLILKFIEEAITVTKNILKAIENRNF